MALVVVASEGVRRLEGLVKDIIIIIIMKGAPASVGLVDQGEDQVEDSAVGDASIVAVLGFFFCLSDFLSETFHLYASDYLYFIESILFI